MIIVALGSNLDGAFGTPYQTIGKALGELAASGIEIEAVSRAYRTRADSPFPQPDFLNAAAIIRTPIPPNALLKIMKRIEALAGRRELKYAHHWIPRPLDLDIVSYKGLVHNWRWKLPIRDRCVILPHPRMHERAFVLQPVSEIAPHWHHPVFGLTAAEFLKRPLVRRRGEILSAGEALR